MELLLRVYRETIFSPNGKERLGNICLLCNKVLNLQSSLTMPCPKFVMRCALQKWVEIQEKVFISLLI
jgi:hypothetical protein